MSLGEAKEPDALKSHVFLNSYRPIAFHGLLF